MNKQAIVIRYIRENYLDFDRIRHDVVSDKLQICVAHSLGDEAMRSSGDEAKGTEYWREMTRQDINSIVCQCAQEHDANISYREVITALQSDLIPDVHPLREYIQSLKPYTHNQPDWIDMVAQQVKVKDNNEENVCKEDNINNLRGNQIAPHSPTRLIGDPALPAAPKREKQQEKINILK